MNPPPEKRPLWAFVFLGLITAYPLGTYLGRHFSDHS